MSEQSETDGTAGSPAQDESPLKFPCVFPIKVMGANDGEFENRVLGMISSHVGALSSTSVTTRPSRNGRFLSVTVTIIAESRAQLDDIYRTVTASEHVLFVL
jgi:putative lipoic acid-binding regulatory protein